MNVVFDFLSWKKHAIFKYGSLVIMVLISVSFWKSSEKLLLKNIKNPKKIKIFVRKDSAQYLRISKDFKNFRFSMDYIKSGLPHRQPF